MTRYVARPRMSYWDETAETICLIEADDEEPIGLLDHHGNELYRSDKQGFIGFGNR